MRHITGHHIQDSPGYEYSIRPASLVEVRRTRFPCSRPIALSQAVRCSVVYRLWSIVHRPSCGCAFLLLRVTFYMLCDTI